MKDMDRRGRDMRDKNIGVRNTTDKDTLSIEDRDTTD